MTETPKSIHVACTQRMQALRQLSHRYLHSASPLSPAELLQLQKLANASYKNQQKKAQARGIAFHLTKMQWLSTWTALNHFPGTGNGLQLALHPNATCYAFECVVLLSKQQHAALQKRTKRKHTG